MVPRDTRRMILFVFSSEYETISRFVGRHPKTKPKGLENSPSLRTSSEQQAEVVNRVTGCTVYIWTFAAEVESYFDSTH